MRAVTPENTEEEEFLLNYSLEMSQAGLFLITITITVQ